jgi:tetratricopeptide (TPR) repeat protein
VLAALKSGAGQEAEWDRLAAWIFAPLDQRKLTPRSNVTVAQRFERMLANDLANQNARNAAANLPRIFRPDADYWVKQADQRVRASAEEMQLEIALEEVRKAVSIDPKHVQAHRLTSRFLEKLQRFDDALAAYKLLVDLPGATAADFANAGYMAALRGWSDEAKSFFGAGTQRFPQEEIVARMEGWALLNLRTPEPALAAFRRSEALLVAAQKKPGADLLAGVVITSWLVEKAEDAVQEYRRLIALDAKYGDATKVRAFAWSEAEVKSMLAALAETLRRHPELAPRSPAPN